MVRPKKWLSEQKRAQNAIFFKKTCLFNANFYQSILEKIENKFTSYVDFILSLQSCKDIPNSAFFKPKQESHLLGLHIIHAVG